MYEARTTSMPAVVPRRTVLRRLAQCLIFAIPVAIGWHPYRDQESSQPSVPTVSQQVSADAVDPVVEGPMLQLDVRDGETNRRTPARFSLVVDGLPYFPERVGEHGLRFVSVHVGKKQTFTVTYARGTGPVEVPLPADARRVEIHVAKGLEYRPLHLTHDVGDAPLEVNATLRRWSRLAEQGWLAAEEHVHYDRTSAESDADWLTMMAGDDLGHAHFLVLKGGNLPGVWARQYAFGPEGEATDGHRLIRAGEEYRDTAQGHINLLGIGELIEPISTGGMGDPPVPFNYPPFYEVFRRAHALGGLGGVAHGASLGREPTAIVDTVLGAVDFFEIANTHLFAVDLWYRLMNCGYHLPPAAGTDLPNYPDRDPWQPFLGGMRMYVKVDGRLDFESWKQSVRRGEVFVTSGPMVSFSVDGHGSGEVVRLPAGGGTVHLDAGLASPLPIERMEIVQNGRVLPLEAERATDDGIHRWRINADVDVERSGWLAVRGEGPPIAALAETDLPDMPWASRRVVAHSAAIRVLVGDEPIRSRDDAKELAETLERQQEYYRAKGSYQKVDDRRAVLQLFDRAISALTQRRDEATR